MALATHIAVVDAGRMFQYGPPVEIYARPATLNVARFIGTANEMPVELLTDSRVKTPAGTLRINAVGPASGDKHAILLTRPEHWRMSDPGEDGALKGRVLSSAFLGPVVEHVVQLGTAADSAETRNVMIRSAAASRHPVGSEVACTVVPDGPLLFPAASE